MATVSTTEDDAMTTEPAAVADLEHRRRRVERLMMIVPYGTLVASVLLTAVAEALHAVPQQPFPVGFGLAALAGVWIAWFVTMHPEWEQRPGLMAVFFAGLVAIILILIWASPLFGFFGWSGYIFAGYALRGRWRLGGAATIAATGAISQMSGYSVFDDRKS